MKYILTILLIIIIHQVAYSADELLSPIEYQPTFSQQVQRKLQKIEENYSPKRITILEFNEYSNLNNCTIRIFPTETYELVRLQTEDEKAYKYSIKDHDNSEAFFVLNGNRLRGIFYTDEKKYEVFPLENSYHAVVLLPDNYMPIPACADDLPSGDNHKDNHNELQDITQELFIRVMVVYTPSASAERGGSESIKEDIELAIYLTNDSYSNSDVSQRVQLARIMEVYYSESSSYITDLNRVTGTSDGYMDDIHSVRDIYSADIVVLIADRDDLCGVAFLNSTSADYAFCLVSSYSTCMTYYYSFAHEMGHIMGCRHNVEVDPNTYPYAYGHGYCYSDGDWRTIMSYNTDCVDRQRYWSNPDILYNGTEMGNTSRADNARVLDDTKSRSMNYLITETDYTIDIDVIDSYDYCDIFVRQNAETNTGLSVESNATLIIRAGNSVKINTGFHSKPGSAFRASIESDTSSEPRDIPVLSYLDQLSETVTNERLINTPNPFSESTRIVFRLEESSNASLIIHNTIGEKVITLLNDEYFGEGQHSVEFLRNNLEAGMYFYTLTTNNFTITEKMIVY